MRGLFANAAEHTGGGHYRAVRRDAALVLHPNSVLFKAPPQLVRVRVRLTLTPTLTLTLTLTEDLTLTSSGVSGVALLSLQVRGRVGARVKVRVR